MGINEIKATAQSPQGRQGSERHGPPIEPLEKARHREKAGSIDLNSILNFLPRCWWAEMRP
jgi:hypothetical protein